MKINEYYQIEVVTWHYVIAYKLLLLDKNAWSQSYFDLQWFIWLKDTLSEGLKLLWLAMVYLIKRYIVWRFKVTLTCNGLFD